MKKSIFGLLSLAVLATSITSCGGSKKGITKSGADYEFITGKPGNSLKEGDMLTLDFKFKVGDSVLSNSSNIAAQNAGKPFEFPLPALDSAHYFEAPVPVDGLYMLNKGDSAVFKMSSKDFFEKIAQPAPEWIKETDSMYWEVKLVNVVTSKDLADKYAAMRKVDANFLKTEKNLEYKFTSLSNSDKVAKIGDIIEFHLVQRIGDSVMMDTKINQQGKAIMQALSAPREEFDLNEGFAMMRPGDKAIFRIPLSALFAKGMPKEEWMNDGDYISFDVDLVSIKTTEEIKKEEEELNNKAAGDNDKQIQDFLKAANITNFKKTESGLYYVVHREGVGPKATKGQTVTVNYTGKLLDGKTFDSNIDPKFGHVTPFDVTLGSGRVIKGWEEAVALFNKGSQVTIYIPSQIGYGANGAGQDIPGNAPLIFDMEIVEIK